jgi:hypothetical protein
LFRVFIAARGTSCQTRETLISFARLKREIIQREKIEKLASSTKRRPGSLLSVFLASSYQEL